MKDVLIGIIAVYDLKVTNLRKCHSMFYWYKVCIWCLLCCKFTHAHTHPLKVLIKILSTLECSNVYNF